MENSASNLAAERARDAIRLRRPTADSTSLLHQDTIGPATRGEGLRRLREFVPLSGRSYADKRNYDFGPSDRSNVSLLSPWIRHRLITESEVVAAVLQQHTAKEADKFIQEVCWRTYWKGWLELRPSVWSDYRLEVTDRLRRLDPDSELRDRLDRALNGNTGINCFDHWVSELKETGYLHNHARMWFASIWIFTLRLPWAIGADFFLRHLLDGDPASNTLSWRWVAGRQTQGKSYLATADNIEHYTAGRFRDISGLVKEAPVGDSRPPPAPRPLPRPDFFDANESTALLLCEEDLSAGDTVHATVRTVGGFVHTAARSPLPVSDVVKDFASAALDDALSRSADKHAVTPQRFANAPSGEDLIDWALAHGCRQIVMPYAPVGPVQEWVRSLQTRLVDSPVRFVLTRRAWDCRLWPLANKGYFQFRQKVPPHLSELT